MLLAMLTAALAPAALADHNSPWGAGWANMPNDVHDLRIETRERGDASAFRDLVRGGAAATDPAAVRRGGAADHSRQFRPGGAGARTRPGAGGGRRRP
jgi:hypothetical protein